MTTDTTAPVPVHLVEVHNDDSAGDSRYSAVCSCGWTGVSHDEPVWAQIEGLAHRDDVDDPDVMDRLMSDLLDIQENLATAVIWLAEHWAAHLPGLEWHGGRGRAPRGGPAVELVAYCWPEVWAAAVEVLDGPVIEDPVPDGGLERYRRVCREWGRVRLELFTEHGLVVAP
jgi:hypothetical protein